MTDPSLAEEAKKIPLVRALARVPWLIGPYHYLVGFLAAWWYRFPSQEMTVIGITGTKGKTSTANLIYQILMVAGRKTGMATSVNFAIGERVWTNETKQTMLGRFALQKLLREMANAGCRYAVIETSSEGILQHRHRFIDYDIGIFTNISPEHIERHGSFERYRDAKVRLFRQIARKKSGIGIYNMSDPNAEYFLEPEMKERYGFAFRDREGNAPLVKKYNVGDYFEIGGEHFTINSTKFEMGGEEYQMPLVGEFNVGNAAAAICTALAEDVPVQKIKAALADARPIPGRFEVVHLGQPFTIIVDYAHEPASLSAVYKAVRLFKPKSVICVLGSQGGGRDKWKRPVMGKIAAKNCDEIILTSEDPYDEDPMQVIEDMKKGVYENSGDFIPVYKIPDRTEAIEKALSIAKKGDAVVLTGKGGEVWMAVENGRKISWNEREVVERIITENPDRFITRSGRNMRYE